jgi:glycosyltransferase involved in cell wall biosynthesis
MRNYGQHSALLAGIFNARHEVIVTMDEDFQTPQVEGRWGPRNPIKTEGLLRGGRRNLAERGYFNSLLRGPGI